MIEGDAQGRGFQYPIPTYSITKEFDWSDTENNRLLFEMTAKYGTPNFSNYITRDMQHPTYNEIHEVFAGDDDIADVPAADMVAPSTATEGAQA